MRRRPKNTQLRLQPCRPWPDSAGAHDRIRTGDLVLTKDVLYRLSYVGLPKPADALPGDSTLRVDRRRLERVMGIEPTQSAWKAGVLPLNYTRDF